MKKSLLVVSVVLAVAMLFGTTSIAFADDPFLCPVVGGEYNENADKDTGVLNADANNGDNGVEAIEPPVGTSFFPGKNKAGEKSNPNAHNTEGPGNPDAGPGDNPDFSPIWPAS
jgi:hypothetical protein